ncbi:hypothetical protein DGG96_16105 [Legionella qingyii]|uniref:Uncharacterized protein n=1 Tax=Legionella qingyii TaxID=2184757 RepID=A0A317U211_9GAMM|nr:hypothetical protein DGG96_18470 [Legionella qingyii]PWY54532.1 hypothetical protein DGG96_16105 [Legionella qingyii]
MFERYLAIYLRISRLLGVLFMTFCSEILLWSRLLLSVNTSVTNDYH